MARSLPRRVSVPLGRASVPQTDIYTNCLIRGLQLLILVLLIAMVLHYLMVPKLSGESDLKEHANAHLCFVIRTYWAHGPSGGDSDPPLMRMLRYLASNEHREWEALILVMDQRPFKELASIVHSFGDRRIRIYAEKVGESYVAKRPDGTWNGEYHDMLYSLTDEAIRACSPNTQWVVLTNGDNEYDKLFIPRLLEAPADTDIVAIDFYSRYQRVTAAPCDRFAAAPGAPACKQNLLRFCNTDLASTIYRWPRFIAEERAFSKVNSYGIGLNDGLLAQLLKSAGWKVHRITDVCLLSHTPSPQLCALHGGVWDDSVYALVQHSGGRCLDLAAAKKMLEEDAGLEVVEVQVSHDGSTFGFEQDKPVQLACVRRRFDGFWQNQFYPHECAAPIDGGYL